MEHVYLYGELFPLTPNNGYAWVASCCPIIKLYVNDEKVLKTARSNKGFFFDAKITFTTAKIDKNATIRIEIWDAKKFMNPNILVFSKIGTVNSFLNKQRRAEGDNFARNANRIETVSFWRDEYE